MFPQRWIIVVGQLILLSVMNVMVVVVVVVVMVLNLDLLVLVHGLSQDCVHRSGIGFTRLMGR